MEQKKRTTNNENTPLAQRDEEDNLKMPRTFVM